MIHDLLSDNASQGIILRVPKSGEFKIPILDRNLGKIEAVLKLKELGRLINGGLIQYDLSKWREIHVINNFELLDVPYNLSPQDILFFHHILELCNYFLPLNKPAEDIFNLVFSLYIKTPELNCFLKKIFITKFFLILSVYPDNFESFDPNFLSLISKPIDIILDRKCDRFIHDELVRWLLGCIQTNPYVNRFNTTNFLV